MKKLLFVLRVAAGATLLPGLGALAGVLYEGCDWTRPGDVLFAVVGAIGAALVGAAAGGSVRKAPRLGAVVGALAGLLLTGIALGYGGGAGRAVLGAGYGAVCGALWLGVGSLVVLGAGGAFLKLLEGPSLQGSPPAAAAFHFLAGAPSLGFCGALCGAFLGAIAG